MVVEPKEDIVMEGYVSEEIRLQCELSRSNGNVRWLKDGQQVQQSDDIQLVSEGPYRRLTILCGSREDTGEYVCETDGDSVFFQLTVTGKTSNYTNTRMWNRYTKLRWFDLNVFLLYQIHQFELFAPANPRWN